MACIFTSRKPLQVLFHVHNRTSPWVILLRIFLSHSKYSLGLLLKADHDFVHIYRLDPSSSSCTTCCKIIELRIPPTECICVSHTALKVNKVSPLNSVNRFGLFSRNIMCSLWGTNWVLHKINRFSQGLIIAHLLATETLFISSPQSFVIKTFKTFSKSVITVELSHEEGRFS
jgi:hypothetical protein